MNNFKLSGEIEIQLHNLNADGSIGETVKVIKKQNLVTDRAFQAIAQGGSLGPNIVLSSETTPANKYNPFINVTNTYPLGAVFTPPQWFDENTEAIPPTPMYVQFRHRWQPPATGTTRNINMVILSNVSEWALGAYRGAGGKELMIQAGHYAMAYVNLDSTCVQTDVQVMDVYYRLKWVWSPLVNGVGQIPMKMLAKHATGVAGMPGFIDNGAYSVFSDLGEVGKQYDTFQVLNLTYYQLPAVTFEFNAPRLRRKCSWTLDATQSNGNIFGSQLWGNSGENNVHGWTPVLSTELDTAIQPLHNHSGASTTPFLDVNNLALGSGRPSATGTWGNPDYPKLVTVNILTTGDVGISTYNFSVVPIFGMYGLTYGVWWGALPWFTYPANSTNIMTGNKTTHNQIELNPSTLHYIADSIIKYDYTSVVTFDSTGITYTTINRAYTINFNATTTPALTATAIEQISVDNSGNVWVACNATGLWKVNPIANTVSHIVVSGVTQQCFGVDIGVSGSIWALMMGGLCHSTNNGATWTVYNESSSPAFIATGVSDSNWNTVSYIRADPTHIDNRVAIIRKSNTSVLPTTAIMWWSITSATVTPIISTALTFLRNNPTGFNVSDTDGFWAGYVNSTVNFGNDVTVEYIIAKFDFGATTITNRSTGTVSPTGYTQPNGAYKIQGIYFEKSSTGEDCVYAFVRGLGTHWSDAQNHWNAHLVLIPPTGTIISTHPLSMGSQSSSGGYSGGLTYSSSFISRPCYLGNGVWTWTRQNCTDSTVGYQLGNTAYNYLYTQVVGQLCFDPNTTTGPLSYMAKRNYGWDGSNWVVGTTTGKQTHLAQELLTEGISLGFAEGNSGDSFVATDSYTFGLCYGMLKDNATTAQGSMNFYFSPMISDNRYLNSGVMGTLPSLSSNTAVTWANTPSSGMTINSTSTNLTTASILQPGFGLYSNETLTGDFVVEWTGDWPTVPNWGLFGLGDQFGNIMWGIANNGTTNPSVGSNTTQLQGFNVAHAYPSTNLGTDATRVDAVTSWKLEKIGQALKLYINGTLKITAATAFLDADIPIKIVHWWPYNYTGKYPIPVIKTNTDAIGVQVGNQVSAIGLYDPQFNLFEDSVDNMHLTLNGAPVAAIYKDGITNPGVNEVALCSSRRAFLCNAADVGKTLAGTYSYLRYVNT